MSEAPIYILWKGLGLQWVLSHIAMSVMPKGPQGPKRSKDLADVLTAGEVGNIAASDESRVPEAKAVSRGRQPAGALGLTSISPDFDDPLPDKLQALFEGR